MYIKQYIGETKRTLRERFKNIDRQQTIHSTQAPQQQSHFNQPGHSIADMGPGAYQI